MSNEEKVVTTEIDEKTQMAGADDFGNSMHRAGRIWSIIAIIAMLAFPILVSIIYKAPPNWRGLGIGLTSMLLIYIPSSIVEVVTFSPMLGTGGSYLAFITGNLTNLKIPCVVNAREIAGTETGTKENEIVSTISVAISAMVTCTVLAVGVLLLSPLTPILSSPVLAPAFNMVLPALFGALAFQYFTKSPKLVVAPLLTMIAVNMFVPALAGNTAILIPISAVVSIGVALLLHKKGKV